MKPRNGEYELFSFQGRTYCFDDPLQDPILTPAGMFEWLRSQPREGCRPMVSGGIEADTAWYLTPEYYLLWKLRWG
jgi:hypothetical protein